MSTNASITVFNPSTDKYETIYVHWDGYPEDGGVGNMLQTYHNTLDDALTITSLGNLSTLKQSLQCPHGHSYNNPVPGCTIAYGRDRGESGQGARVYNTLHDAMDNERQQYNYYFDPESKQWFIMSNSTPGAQWVPLSEIIQNV